ncbi:DUF6263 family protein [Polaribacter sp. IC073]|uniref:DUF6263 family protein n=1 Tax=Polaribacter sp. IC073 TaxID=2508540 RepID=UPI0011BE647D|nr:DUF6263 family protein [Polaribacter sp. IC073]TXD48833.1 hypothetical protein ES045_06320 [Polaribacter sp. IC073]
MKKLLYLFVLATTFSVTSQESVLLRANYSKGDVLVVKLDQSQDMGAQGGVDMKMTMDMIVTSKEGEVITTESKIKAIDMNMLQGGTVMSFNSSMKEADLDQMGKMMKQQFDPMMKATIISKMTTEGDILETKVEPSTPAMEQFTKQAKGVKYPKEKVSVGSSWTDETNEQGMEVKTTYTVSKIENGKVYIDILGAVSGVGTGDVTGNLIVDVKTGIQDTANMEMSLSANGTAIKISTKSSTTKM